MVEKEGGSRVVAGDFPALPLFQSIYPVGFHSLENSQFLARLKSGPTLALQHDPLDTATTSASITVHMVLWDICFGNTIGEQLECSILWPIHVERHHDILLQKDKHVHDLVAVWMLGHGIDRALAVEVLGDGQDKPIIQRQR